MTHQMLLPVISAMPALREIAAPGLVVNVALDLWRRSSTAVATARVAAMGGPDCLPGPAAESDLGSWTSIARGW